MKKLIHALLLFSLLASALAAEAAPAGRSRATRERAPSLRGWFALGFDLRSERAEDQTQKPVTFPTASGGFQYGHWLADIEGGQYQQSSGNATLSVDRRVQTFSVWNYWLPTDMNLLAPYLGAGVGGIQEQVTTTLYGSSEVDRSPWGVLGGGAIGLRYTPGVFIAMIEGRLLKSPRLDPDPMLGVVARIGFEF